MTYNSKIIKAKESFERILRYVQDYTDNPTELGHVEADNTLIKIIHESAEALRELEE